MIDQPDLILKYDMCLVLVVIPSLFVFTNAGFVIQTFETHG